MAALYPKASTIHSNNDDDEREISNELAVINDNPGCKPLAASSILECKLQQNTKS